METKVKKLPKSGLELEVELTEEEFKKHVDRALLHLRGHMKMDGFREGHVPLDIVEKKVGQENLLMEAGDLAIKESYTRYVNENNLEPIGDPEVQILKIAKGNPMVFKIKFSVLPEISLPDYKEIARQVYREETRAPFKKGARPSAQDLSALVSVDEKEIKNALKYLQKSQAKFSQAGKGAENGDFIEIEYQNKNINKGKAVKDRFILGERGFMKDFEDNVAGMKAGDEKEFKAKFPNNAPNNSTGKESNFRVKMLSVQKVELPEINDEFAKSLGMFDGLVALQNNIKEGIIVEKQEVEKQRRWGEILSKIADKIKFALPERMIELEKERLLEDLKNQIAEQFKMPLEEYLETVKKTEEEMKKSLAAEAEKKIKNYLVLKQIGKTENIEASREEVSQEMNKFIRSYTREQAEKIDIGQLKEYTKATIINEKIFQFLENLSK